MRLRFELGNRKPVREGGKNEHVCISVILRCLLARCRAKPFHSPGIPDCAGICDLHRSDQRKFNWFITQDSSSRQQSCDTLAKINLTEKENAHRAFCGETFGIRSLATKPSIQAAPAASHPPVQGRARPLPLRSLLPRGQDRSGRAASSIRVLLRTETGLGLCSYSSIAPENQRSEVGSQQPSPRLRRPGKLERSRLFVGTSCCAQLSLPILSSHVRVQASLTH